MFPSAQQQDDKNQAQQNKNILFIRDGMDQIDEENRKQNMLFLEGTDQIYEDNIKQNQLFRGRMDQIDEENRKQAREHYFSQKRFWYLNQEIVHDPEITLSQQFNQISMEDKERQQIMTGKQIIKLQSSRKFAKMFQQPTYTKSLECLKDTKDYYFCFLPVGTRCFLISKKGKTVARSIKGNYIKSFSSLLPGGGCQSQFDKFSCIIDCVFSGDIFYILDIIVWNGMELCNQETEFRLFWIHSNINREIVNLGKVSKDNEIPIQFIQMLEVNSIEQMNMLFIHEMPYLKQGLLVTQKTSTYMQGINPSVYILKNQDVKWNFRETIIMIKNVKAYFRVNYKGDFYCLENHKLGQFNEKEMNMINRNLKWMIFEFIIKEITEYLGVFQCQYQVIGSSKRVLEDSLSKILFWLTVV